MLHRRLRPGFVAVFATGAFAACRAPAPEPPVPPDAHVVEVVAEDYAFDGPAEILSGWTTFRLRNEGDETHFLLVTRLPDGRTYDEYMEDVSLPFNEIWTALRDGEVDKEGALERFGVIPAWYWTGAEVMGGPGMVAAGGVSQVTVELEPGTYVLECFMKTPEGELHWVEGMIAPLTVTAARSAASEPPADIWMTLTTEGFDIGGELTPGYHRVAVRFAEQPEAGFGNDVHVVRLDDGMDAEELLPWMDFLNVRGLQNPAPGTFVGGTHERTKGATLYFTVNLEAGRYAWISEGPAERGMVSAFTVPR